MIETFLPSLLAAMGAISQVQVLALFMELVDELSEVVVIVQKRLKEEEKEEPQEVVEDKKQDKSVVRRSKIVKQIGSFPTASICSFFTHNFRLLVSKSTPTS